jgi:hypothetical protein
LLQVNIDDAHERRSALCPYEWERAKRIILDKLPVQESGELGPWFGTVGDPKLRLWPRNIDQFSPSAVLDKWRRTVTKLRKLNPDVFGFCIVELQLCRALERPAVGEPRYFFEPHFHFVLWGVTKEQAKAAFQMRPNPRVTVRKRPVKIQAVYDLHGATAYMTKARPDVRIQIQRKDGSTGWNRSTRHKRHRAKWLRIMARYKPTDLLSSTGISLRILGQPGRAELATASKRKAP